MPDPVSAGFSPGEEAAWYARLPTMFAAGDRLPAVDRAVSPRRA